MNIKKSSYKSHLIVILSCVLMSSCSIISPRVIDTNETRETQSVVGEPSANERAEKPGSNRHESEAESGKYVSSINKKIDIFANNVPAKKFFGSLVSGTSKNMIVHPDVKGKISLRLRQVTVIDALKAVRDLYGYDFDVSSYGIKILPKQVKTKVFAINYLNVTREGYSDMSIDSGQDIDDPVDTVSNSNKVSTHHSVAFWSSLEKTLKLIAANDKDASIVIDPHAGLVVVYGKPETINGVARYLDRAQLSINRQVQIEAKLIEVTLRDGFKTGIRWNALLNKENPVLSGLLTSGSITNAPQEGIFSLSFQDNDFSGVLQALETQGDVNVLSSPRIATVNNQKAVIKVGSDDFFVTGIKKENTSDGGKSSPEILLSRFFSGIALDVTPQIGEDDNIILHVHPKVTDVREKTKSIEVDDSDFVLPLASSSVRETDSIVQAKSGQVVAIGGLMQNKVIDKESKIPLLGDIPILGYLFKQKDKEIVQSELVILIQPKIIEKGLTKEEIKRINKRYSSTLISPDDHDDDEEQEHNSNTNAAEN